MATRPPFDAVLLIAFGGPQGRDDIRPFLANVLRGRRVPPARVEEVAHHYELFDGVSPLTALTREQAEGLTVRLAALGAPLPVYVGMRNWHPFLTDTLHQMSHAGVRRAVGFIMSAYRSFSSCGQYRENVLDARRALRTAARADVDFVYVGDWHVHEKFIAAVAGRVQRALDDLPAPRRAQARLVFTAHSIPMAMARGARYVEQLRATSALVAQRLGRADWTLVFQSRSGRPDDPWLEPDVCDYLRSAADQGLDAVVLCPVGFLADHVEVLYDLDREAADVCRALALPMTRAAAVNADPLFLDMMAEVVLATIERYARGRPLPIAPATPVTGEAGPRDAGRSLPVAPARSGSVS